MDKIKQVFSHNKDSTSSGHHESHNATSTTGASTGGDRSATERVAANVEDRVDGRSTNNSATTGRTDPLDANARGSATGATGASGIAGQGASHIHEHAKPPHHTHNHPREDGLLDEQRAKSATHDHQHLAPVTHETRQKHEVEEIERQREVDRHVHHVQHHVQPVVDTQHQTEARHEKALPTTEINERHVATAEDKAQFAALATGHDSVREAPREKVIVDKGEQVHEHTSHHVHHVVQPEIERDVHEHHRIHTTVPIHQTTHEAPIVHESVAHEPLSMKAFQQGGGDLSSTVRHDGNLLDRGECERTVDGPAESLTESLGLGGRNSSSATTGTTGNQQQRAL